jgi:hypothetical protein
MITEISADGTNVRAFDEGHGPGHPPRLDNEVFCPAHALDLFVAQSIHSQIRATIRDVIYRHEINLLRVRATDSEVIDATSVRAVLATTAPDR